MKPSAVKGLIANWHAASSEIPSGTATRFFSGTETYSAQVPLPRFVSQGSPATRWPMENLLEVLGPSSITWPIPSSPGIAGKRPGENPG